MNTSNINKSTSVIVLILMANFIFSLFYFSSLALTVSLDVNVEQFLFQFFTAIFLCSTLATYYISKFLFNSSFLNKRFALNNAITLGFVIINLALIVVIRYLAQDEPFPVYGIFIMFVLLLVFLEGLNNE